MNDTIEEGRTVGIPQRVARAGGERAHNGVPLRGRSVNTNIHTSRRTSAKKAVEKVTVVVLISPVLGTFNIEPQHTNGGTRGTKRFDGSFDLAFGVSTVRAREAAYDG